MKLEELKKYREKNIAILGFGKEGKSSLDFLLSLKFTNISILDNKLDIEKKEDINYVLGDKYLDNLGNFDLIFKSPGISPYNKKISPYKEKLLTQTQIFFNNYKGKVIGITGTKGKSTTSTLTYETLKKVGYNTKLVGNIGNPVLDEIDIINEENHDYVIYELSSYMLEGLDCKLYIGVINNIYDCHLDWHEGRNNYEKAKFGVLRNSEHKLVNYELKNSIDKKTENLYLFGENGNYHYKNLLFYKNEQLIMKDKKIALQGEHNRKNICVTIGILDIINENNLTNNIIILKNTLLHFKGLPHRLENIGTYKDITFIDDAIATTPESTIAAIKTYEQNIGTIFLGGQDSGFKFNELKNILEKYNILNIVLFPDTGEKIFGDLNNYNYESVFNLEGNYSPKIFKTKKMKSAVDFAYKNTPKGKICILSCASPSYSLWSGYIEKGNLFQNEVKNYKINLLKST